MILALFSALLLVLSFSRLDAGFLAWVGFLPLFFSLEGKSPGRSFLLSYLCGFSFFLVTLYWLIHVTLAGWIVLCFYLALYFGLFGAALRIFKQASPALMLFALPSAWVILEYLRSHLLTGFGWALLGYSQYKFLPIIQIADIFGSYGVSFLLVMGNAAIYLFLRRRRQALTGTAIFLGLLAAVLAYGFFRLREDPLTREIKVAVVQGNIPQEWKWREDKKNFSVDEYCRLSSAAAEESPQLIIWPETAFPGYLWEDPALFSKVLAAVREIKTPFLLGLVTMERGGLFNSAMLISAQGEPLQVYNKLHLVPFGEYIPLRRALPFLETIVPIGDFTAGKEYTIFSLPPTLPPTYYLLPTKFSVLICFEDTVPELARAFTLNGAQFLVNITNDAWFKDTTAPFQHLMASVLRAVENRRALVRAANTGISVFIGPDGKILGQLQHNGKPTFVEGFLANKVRLNHQLTFYTKAGDWLVFLCAVFLAVALALRFNRSS